MSTLKMIATVAYIIICIALVIVVLMQEGKTSGLGALSGRQLLVKKQGSFPGGNAC